MKQWYSHLVEVESIIYELDQMNLSSEEKLHLAKLVDSSLHHTILNVVLSQLSDKDKRKFVSYINDNDDDKIWKFLNEKVADIEIKVRKVADDLKKELVEDLLEAKKLR